MPGNNLQKRRNQVDITATLLNGGLEEQAGSHSLSYQPEAFQKAEEVGCS